MPEHEPTIAGRVDAVILDAAMRQALVATRSLGHSGLSVGVVERRSATASRWSAPAFSSRWAALRSVVADFETDPDEYAKAVLELVQLHPGAVVVCCSDQSLGSIRPWRRAIEQHGSVALGSEAALAIAVDKVATIRLAAELGIAVPPTIVVRSPEEGREALREVGYPAVVKPAMSWSRERAGGRLLAREVLDDGEAEATLRSILGAGMPVHVQPWLGGARETVSVFRAGGKVTAAFAETALRTTPVLGGASVIRESIPLAPDLSGATLKLVDAMDLDGFSCVEFRRDADGNPQLMEVNARLPGSLELAVSCGVDFPLMLWQWATGRPVEAVEGYRTGLRMRWLTGDVRWLVETIRHGGRPDSLSSWKAISLFARSFGHVQAYDLVDLVDPKPALAEAARVVARAGRGFASVITGGNHGEN